MVYGEKTAYFMKEILINPASWNADFSGLHDRISILVSKDKKVKVFTWAIPLHNDYYYIGFIQHYNKKTKIPDVFRLYDESSKIKKPEKKYLSPNRWYGCVYYEMIEKRYKRHRYYTLLGADPDGDLLNRKIIDVLTFRSNGIPRFGYNFRDENGKPVKRFIFQYNNQASMLLRWNKQLKMIVFDHLSPSEPKFKGMYQFYGPDFSYDGLKFIKGRWVYEKDVDVRDKHLK
jgi:hypothetical protein